MRHAKPSIISIPQAANALPQPIPCWAPMAQAGILQHGLGDILIQAGRYNRVIIVPMAMGGTSISVLNNERADLITNGLSRS